MAVFSGKEYEKASSDALAFIKRSRTSKVQQCYPPWIQPPWICIIEYYIGGLNIKVTYTMFMEVVKCISNQFDKKDTS